MGCIKSKEKNKKKEVEEDNSTYAQAGGHGGGVQFAGDRVTKVTKIDEVINYRKIFDDHGEQTSLTKMRKFLPMYYDDEEHETKEDRWYITVENLLYGKENGSFIDLKLGTSTLTSDKDDRASQIASRKLVDSYTCSADHGFTICGMNLKDPKTGKPRNEEKFPGGKIGKTSPPKNIEEAKEYLVQFFQSNEGGVIDRDAIEYCRQEMAPIIDYFENENEHIMRGMSIFIVTESAKRKYVVKLIDFVSIEKIPDDQQKEDRDQGLVKGLKEIDRLLQQLLEDNEESNLN